LSSCIPISQDVQRLLAVGVGVFKSIYGESACQRYYTYSGV
jgi:hypothetical protein